MEEKFREGGKEINDGSDVGEDKRGAMEVNVRMEL